MKKKKNKNLGTVTKNRAIKIFKALGFKTADKWDAFRLQKKLVNLRTLADGVELDSKTQKRVNEVLRAQNKDHVVVVVDVEDIAADKERAQGVKDAQARVAAKGKLKKAKATKKGKPAAKKSKKKEPKKPGVIASILEFIQAGPVSKKQLLSKLTKRFPDRPVDGMTKTIQVQLPNRMAKEKKIKIKVDDKGRFSVKK